MILSFVVSRHFPAKTSHDPKAPSTFHYYYSVNHKLLATNTRQRRMSSWNDNEVLHLIQLWAEESIQEQLEGAKRNKHMYEKIAQAMRGCGSEKTGD